MSAPQAASRPRYLGIDPGRAKCGFAVVFENGERDGLDVVPTATVEGRIDEQVRAGGVIAFCVGHATTSGAIVELCRRRWPNVELHVVDETNSTFEARALYFADHPPKGLWRLVPRGLLVPNVALDGYAALIIVQRYKRSLEEGRERPHA